MSRSCYTGLPVRGSSLRLLAILLSFCVWSEEVEQEGGTLRSEEEAAYQAAAEAVVASEFGAEVFGLEIKSVDPKMATMGVEDWKGRCLRAGSVLEFRTESEKDEYGIYAGEDALADRIRRIGMCRLAPFGGSALLTGQEDPFIDPAIISKIPTGDISGDEDEENALLTAYFEQSKELVRSKRSVVEALAQRLLSRGSLSTVEIAEVLEASDT
jgi:hypothetical protein